MERTPPSPERAALHATDQDLAPALHGVTDARPVEAQEAPARELSEKRPFRPIGRIRSLTKRLENGAGEELLEALQAEVLLLREENAQLRIKLERTPELGDVVEQMHALTARGPTQKDTGDHAWHLLTEGLVMRDALVDLCQRTRETMAALEGSLQQLDPLEVAGSLKSANGAADDHANGNGILLAGAAGVTASNGSAVSPVEAVASVWPLEINPSPHSSNGHVTEDQKR
jgi:hypothetical protein